MPLQIEITEEKKNLLIGRTEITFRLDHFGEGTPRRLDIKKKIAAMQGSDEKLTIIRKLQTKFGSSHIIGQVFIYKDASKLQFYEPFHIQVRNLEKEKREEVYELKNRKEPYKHLFEY
ncbi:hypothetical protein LCGC14_1223020 [marine sediment metagenome]|uniref:30S ribosomal protein S24e n=1 Tax=marine sediment metagenome TaxID=412755 RepID=A0A0F9NT12_9ZZZZ